MAKIHIDNSMNLFNLLEQRLEEVVKKEMTSRLVASEMKLAEQRIRPMVETLVESLVFDRITGARDVLSLRDEIHVYLHMDDKDPVHREIG